jgi:hypothetical protein
MGVDDEIDLSQCLLHPTGARQFRQNADWYRVNDPDPTLRSRGGRMMNRMELMIGAAVMTVGTGVMLYLLCCV